MRLKYVQDSSRASWFQITRMKSSRGRDRKENKTKKQSAPLFRNREKELATFFSMNGDISYYNNFHNGNDLAQ
jgi:hypothetical protein